MSNDFDYFDDDDLFGDDDLLLDDDDAVELDNIFHAPIPLTTDDLPKFDFDDESFLNKKPGQDKKRKSGFDDDSGFDFSDAFDDDDLFGDDLSFDDDLFGDDLSFGDDSGFSTSRKAISHKEPDPLPERVGNYLIYAIIERFKAQKSLGHLMLYRRTLQQFDKRAHTIVKKLVKKWLNAGDYQSVVTGTIFLMTYDENSATDVVDYAIEHDTISLLTQAIQNHRAKQGGTIIYTMLFLTLLMKQNKRAYDVYDGLLDHLNDTHHSAGKGMMLISVTVMMILVGLPLEEKQLAEQFITQITEDNGKEDDFFMGLRFAQTLFDKSHIDRLYAVSRIYWDGIQSRPYRASFKSGLIDNMDGWIKDVEGLLTFPIFQLRNHDFISPWIATPYHFNDTERIESFLELQVIGAYLMKQPDPIKRILFIKGSDINYFAQRLFGMTTTMLDLLAPNPPHGFYEFPKLVWDTLEDDTDKSLWRLIQALLTSLWTGEQVDIQPLLDEILTHEDALNRLISGALLLILNQHPQTHLVTQHIAEQLTARVTETLQKNSFSARVSVLVTLKKLLKRDIESIFDNMILVWLALGNHADAIQFFKQLPNSLVVILLSPQFLDHYDEKPDDWDDSYWAHYATLQQTYLDTLKKIILTIAPTLPEAELSYLASQVNFTPFTNLSDTLKAISPALESIPKPLVEDDFEPLSLDLPTSELQAQRKAHSEHAYNLAKKRIPQAKNEFDEAVRLARIVQTQAIPKPLDDITQDLIYTIISKTGDVAPIVAQLQHMPPYYHRHRDKMTFGVVSALVDTQRLKDALTLCEMMTVDPWRIQAHAKLIEALVVANKREDADAWVARAEGKYNRFMVVCAYALGLMKIRHADADTHHQMVQNAIQALPRPTLQASASRHYALALLKMGHAQADFALQQALDFTLTTSDMLTRFYGLSDMLEALLAHQHRLSKVVLGHLLAVLNEGENTPLPPLPDLGYPAQYQQQIAEQAQRIWRWVGVGFPVWDVMARLNLATLLFNYQYADEAQKLIQQAQVYQGEVRWLPWDVSLEFTKIAQPNQLKLTFENLGALPLNQVLEIILAWDNLFNQLEHDLADTITSHILRLFRWVGYEVGDVSYLISPKRQS